MRRRIARLRESGNLAWPALAAGVALALMETLNDIGAVEFFGVRTPTVAVYDTWLYYNSLAGAAQIACIMLAFVFALLAIERAMRAGRAFHHTTGRYRHLPEDTLEGAAGVLASMACALPVLFGFLLPGGLLVHDALADIAAGLAPGFWQAALNSLPLAAAASCLAVGFAVVLGYARRQTRSKLIHVLSAIPAVSYAVPGTVLAIGILIPLAGLDNAVDAAMRKLFGVPTGLLLSGSVFAIVLAYTIRFSRRLLGSGRGWPQQDLPQHRTRRRGPSAPRSARTLRRVHLPLLRPALAAAALLVFVDAMKELPATLLLRPFNFDTLATQVFTLASLYRYEEAGLSALTIVLASLVPVLFLHGMIVAGRPGGSPKQAQNGLKRSQRGRPRPLDKSINSGAGGSLSRAYRAKRFGVSGGRPEGGPARLEAAASERVDRDGMKPGQLPWKWFLFGLLAVLLLGIALIPWLIGDTTRFADQAAVKLSAWTGGKAKFTGPVRVSIFPDIRSVRSPFELTDSTRLALMRSLVARDAKISLDLVDLLRGTVTSTRCGC